MTDPTARRRRQIKLRPVELDEPLRWGCSSKGWHCCVDMHVPVRPYDMLRLRHEVGKPAQHLINDQMVTFSWDESGFLTGRLATRPYERDREACIFFEELTNVQARALRENEPGRFATLPDHVRQAATSERAGEWRIAGLCGVHAGRPEACRGYPFQRDPARERREHDSPVVSVGRCGTCSLSGNTTVREVLTENNLDEFWRADDAWLDVARYAHSRGAANIDDPDYRRLPLDRSALTELWVATYVPDTTERVIERFGEQWRERIDIEGDRDLYRMLLEEFIERVDTAVEASGLAPEVLGGPDEIWPRPDLDHLLDAARPLLPVIEVGDRPAA